MSKSAITLVPGRDYRGDWNQSLDWSADEEICLSYPEQAPSPEGVVCPRCGEASERTGPVVAVRCAVGLGIRVRTAGTCRQDADAAEDVARRRLVPDQPEVRGERLGAAAGVGTGELRDELGDAHRFRAQWASRSEAFERKVEVDEPMLGSVTERNSQKGEV